MTSPVPEQPPQADSDRPPSGAVGDPGERGLARAAFWAAVGIFTVAFITMVILSIAVASTPSTARVLDTCRWLMALTVPAVIGLLPRRRG